MQAAQRYEIIDRNILAFLYVTARPDYNCLLFVCYRRVQREDTSVVRH